MIRVELSAFVEADLEEIADYIAQDNPARAVSLIREIRQKFRQISLNPLLYRLRPEIGDEARVAMVGRYIILFRIVANVARIERVVYGSRDLPGVYSES